MCAKNFYNGDVKYEFAVSFFFTARINIPARTCNVLVAEASYRAQDIQGYRPLSRVYAQPRNRVPVKPVIQKNHTLTAVGTCLRHGGTLFVYT